MLVTSCILLCKANKRSISLSIYQKEERNSRFAGIKERDWGCYKRFNVSWISGRYQQLCACGKQASPGGGVQIKKGAGGWFAGPLTACLQLLIDIQSTMGKKGMCRHWRCVNPRFIFFSDSWVSTFQQDYTRIESTKVVYKRMKMHRWIRRWHNLIIS